MYTALGAAGFGPLSLTREHRNLPQARYRVVAPGADQQTAVLLTIEGVWLATRGYADDIQKEGFPPLREVLQSFVANGGEIWTCGTCAKPRGITENDMVEGARIVTAAYVVEQIAGGASTFAL